MQFGKIDRTDFLIPPFMLFYFYLVFANVFDLPSISRGRLFHAEGLAWTGVGFCLAGLVFLAWSLVSFGGSFRIGIDLDKPGALVTSGAFAVSRNPIYVAFASVFLGQFLVFPNWVLLAYLGGAIWLFHRQVLREEAFMKEHYGEEFTAYCKEVRRYL